MNINAVIQNELVQDGSSVWMLKGHSEFRYSDGAESERYLESVFRDASDLSTRSDELESHIKDWPSEYHLSTKRAQLLAGFNFDRSLKVLEVGCGCGAITRHLGESFDEVISIEGSLPRARLARQRSRDLESVSIVCAPFQDIRFTQKFDIIFCIGVYEYSASFVGGDDPYNTVLQYFSDLLSPNGVVVMAIENQFGLKYFNGVREDHLGAAFEGLEGYRRRRSGVRTFGKGELESNLKKHFSEVRFYYPYPDYKLPECVISRDLMASGRAGELVSQMKPRDYFGPQPPLWDQSATLLELARNGALEFFSDSFLVLAGHGRLGGVTFDQQAILFSSGRRPEFSTRTRIYQAADGQLMVSKRSRANKGVVEIGALRLVDADTVWTDAQSLQTRLMFRARSGDRSFAEIFEPCRKWVALLLSDSTVEDDTHYLGGEHVDSIWQNVYPMTGECRIVDREWVWNRKLRMNVVVIRAIFNFLVEAEAFAGTLLIRNGRSAIRKIADAIGVKLSETDFQEFIDLESDIRSLVFRADKNVQAAQLRAYLRRGPTPKFLKDAKPQASIALSRVRERLSSLGSRFFYLARRYHR